MTTVASTHPSTPSAGWQQSEVVDTAERRRYLPKIVDVWRPEPRNRHHFPKICVKW
ncbi:hypothetical protein V3N99_00365 [Dermatophilaceae bacterium Soc4.6]